MTSTPLPGHPAPEPSRRYLPWIVAVAAVVVIVDQLTKWWAESTLSDGRAIPVIGEFLQWRLIYNPGAAFGIGGQFTWILTVIAAAAVVGLCIFATRVFNPFWRSAWQYSSGERSVISATAYSARPASREATWWTSSTTTDSSWVTWPTSPSSEGQAC